LTALARSANKVISANMRRGSTAGKDAPAAGAQVSKINDFF
jgi:hypothetical protein